MHARIFVAACTVKSSEVYLLADKARVEFADTVLTESKTATVKLFGFNLTDDTALTLEGANAAMFSLSANSVSAANANASAGYEVTVTFTPTTEAGLKTATLRVTNATDNVSMLVALKGKGVTE